MSNAITISTYNPINGLFRQRKRGSCGSITINKLEVAAVWNQENDVGCYTFIMSDGNKFWTDAEGARVIKKMLEEIKG